MSEDRRHWRLGVDSGGTFTDVCLFEEESGELRVTKVSSTPDDPSRAIVAGVGEILGSEGRLANGGGGDVTYFGHGTTVATNALIQGRGAATGLITTAGFRDLLEIGRQRRPDLYDLQADKPEPLVRRDRRLEVRERVHFDGRVERPLDETEVRAAVRRLKEMGARSVAVCLLYSYVFPHHEDVVKRVVQEEFPEAFVSISHEVVPEFREFERLSTVVINAYLGPVMSSYLRRLAPELVELDVRVPPHITQSNGGVISFETAQEHPVRTVLSGPSTGLVGGSYVAGLAGYRDLITFDMGGTSTDVSLINDGQPRLTGEMEVEGRPIKTPMLDIRAVGAGGGSIAWIDSGGLLKVGPQSAGAVPGPVCYGLGSREPTVTDANVVLQTLNPTHLLGGKMPIDGAAARRAIEDLAGRLGLDLLATAQGIVSVVTANMAKAIRVISVQRGYDPRDYTLVAFGGAGPLHAGRLARELEIPRVLVPATPGVLCALGLLVTDLRTNYSITRVVSMNDQALSEIEDGFAELERRATMWLEQEGIPPDRRLLKRSVDMRYAGQNFELNVSAPPGSTTAGSVAALLEGFGRAHDQMYGYTAPEEPVQAVTFRVEAVGVVPRAELRSGQYAGEGAGGAVVGRRDVYMPEADGYVGAPVYDRTRLGAGNRLSGPAVIEQMDSTTLILPGQVASADPFGNLVVEVNRR
jgi:N-methylhydantoinase A